MKTVILFAICIIFIYAKIRSTIYFKEKCFPRTANLGGRIGSLLAEILHIATAWYVVDVILNS